jgi:hypothetical protein
MSKRVRQVKRGLRNDRSTLRKLRGSVVRQADKKRLLRVQRRLAGNQLILDKVLERIAFHKAKTKREQAKNKVLRDKLRGR